MKTLVRKRILALLLLQPLVAVPHSQGADGPGVSKTAVVLGQSAAFTGASAGLGTELWRGAEAYFKKLNAEGGVNGRKIRVLALDDKYDGDVTMPNTLDLITKHKVFGLFGYVGTPTIVKALPVVQRFQNENIFLFSNFTGAEPQRNPPHDAYVFNVRTSYRNETKGLVENFLKIGMKKIGVFIQDDAYGRTGADGVAKALEGHGLKLETETTYRRGVAFESDFTEQANILKDAGVEVVISIGSYAAGAGFIRDARKAGYRGVIANVSFVGPRNLLALLVEAEKKTGLALKGKLVNSVITPLFSNEKIPVVKEYLQAMKAHAHELDPKMPGSTYQPFDRGFISLEGYINAKVFASILRRAKEPLTRRSFLAAAEATRELDIGAGEKITYGPGDHQGFGKVHYVTLAGEEFVELKDWNVLR